MQRNKTATKQRILDALEHLLAEKGFSDIGVNTVAREAGCDKVLIYRYFGGLDGLLRTYAAEQGLMPSIDDFGTGGGNDADAPRDISKQILLHFARALRKRPAVRETLIWELAENNELTAAVADSREQEGLKLLSLYDRSDIDMAALASILSAGLTYLALRGKTADVYNGIELNTENGWRRIENAAVTCIDLLFDTLEEKET